MIVNMEFAKDGVFTLSDGSLGNPGCDGCGYEDAVVYIDCVYMCHDGLQLWIDDQLNK